MLRQQNGAFLLQSANLLPERKTLFSTGCAFELCGMRIEAFTVPHDVDTVGFVFRVGDRKLGVATDLGHLNMLARQKLHDCAVLVLRAERLNDAKKRV